MKKEGMIMPLRQTTIRNGIVQGVPCGNPKYTVYRGIPYAASTAGKNRFRGPQPPKSWEGVRVCDTFSEICMQRGGPFGMPFADLSGSHGSGRRLPEAECVDTGPE